MKRRRAGSDLLAISFLPFFPKPPPSRISVLAISHIASAAVKRRVSRHRAWPPLFNIHPRILLKKNTNAVKGNEEARKAQKKTKRGLAIAAILRESFIIHLAYPIWSFRNPPTHTEEALPIDTSECVQKEGKVKKWKINEEVEKREYLSIGVLCLVFPIPVLCIGAIVIRKSAGALP